MEDTINDNIDAQIYAQLQQEQERQQSGASRVDQLKSAQQKMARFKNLQKRFATKAAKTEAKTAAAAGAKRAAASAGRLVATTVVRGAVAIVAVATTAIGTPFLFVLFAGLVAILLIVALIDYVPGGETIVKVLEFLLGE